MPRIFPIKRVGALFKIGKKITGIDQRGKRYVCCCWQHEQKKQSLVNLFITQNTCVKLHGLKRLKFNHGGRVDNILCTDFLGDVSNCRKYMYVVHLADSLGLLISKYLKK